MTKRSKEYDAFGPWVYIIDEEHTLPKLFVPYEEIISAALMSFKIPRNVERRNAHPDMFLYDSVVSVFDTHIIVLNRVRDKVVEAQIRMADIVAVENSNIFLLGKVSIYTKDRKFEIKYNTVSKEIIELFVNIVLMNITYFEHRLNLDFLHYDTETIDYLFTLLINRQHKKDDSIGLVAYQPKYKVESRKDIISRVLDAYSKDQDISCTAFLANPKKIVIINRSSPLKEEDEADYAYTYVYLPIHNITDAKILETAGDSMNEFTIKVYDYEFSTKFNDASKGIEELHYFLSGRDIA